MLHLEFVAEAALKKIQTSTADFREQEDTVYHLVIDRKTGERASEA